MRDPIFPLKAGYLFETEVMQRAEEKWGAADALARLVGQHLLAGTLGSWKVDKAGQQTKITAEEYRSNLKLRDALAYRPRGRYETRYREPPKFRVVFLEADIDRLFPTFTTLLWQVRAEKQARIKARMDAKAENITVASPAASTPAQPETAKPPITDKTRRKEKSQVQDVRKIIADLWPDGILPDNAKRRDSAIIERAKSPPYEIKDLQERTIRRALKDWTIPRADRT